MAPFYEEVCRDLGWKVDQTLLAKMKNANEEKLKELEETIEDAEKSLGEMEVREANLKKSEYLCRIGDKVFFYFGFLHTIFLFSLPDSVLRILIHASLFAGARNIKVKLLIILFS
jgi:hypothetical protein